MRGKLLGPVDDVFPVRIIPARAGQTHCTTTSGRPSADHPRACGANRRDGGAAGDRAGSSPRVRGKPRRRNPNHRHHRIIPARAGQTTLRFHSTFRSSDHPRACGANNAAMNIPVLLSGSSPRVRGKRPSPQGRARHGRIIPARAGQTSARSARTNESSDHPRACGANRRTVRLFGVSVGSSPRVRGKRHALVGQIEHLRIIPARAGQTATPKAVVIIPPDHPRACGANSIVLLTALGGGGSSPRVRGKRWRRSGFPRRVRIIPARAGQTSKMPLMVNRYSDHPRACGANSRAFIRFCAVSGSSPRVRGKPGQSDRRHPQHRIIPARAGQT